MSNLEECQNEVSVSNNYPTYESVKTKSVYQTSIKPMKVSKRSVSNKCQTYESSMQYKIL